MRWRAVLILIFAAITLCVPMFTVASPPAPAGVIGVYDATDDEFIPDHSPGLLPTVPILPGPSGAHIKVSLSVQPAFLCTADP